MKQSLQDIVAVAAQRTGTNLQDIDPAFINTLVELIGLDCAAALDKWLTACNSNAMIGWRGKHVKKHFGLSIADEQIFPYDEESPI